MYVKQCFASHAGYAHEALFADSTNAELLGVFQECRHGPLHIRNCNSLSNHEALLIHCCQLSAAISHIYVNTCVLSPFMTEASHAHHQHTAHCSMNALML
eukprot:2291099-Amphidinium_carterae.2